MLQNLWNLRPRPNLVQEAEDPQLAGGDQVRSGDARPVLLNLGEPGGLDITPRAARVQLIDARYAGDWEIPVLSRVAAPGAVLIRPDGYVAWVGDGTDTGLRDALTTWFGSR